MNSDYFIFFSSCKLVRGANRSIICDFQRNKLLFIPNDLYNFVIKHRGQSISEIKIENSKNDIEIIDEYLDFLISNDFVFIGSHEDSKLMCEMSEEWDYHGVISNALYEYSLENRLFVDKIFKELNFLKCKSIEIVSHSIKLNLNNINDLMTKINSLNYLTNVTFIMI